MSEKYDNNRRCWNNMMWKLFLWATNDLPETEFLSYSIHEELLDTKRCWASGLSNYQQQQQQCDLQIITSNVMSASKKSLKNFYLLCNLVYLTYAIGILSIDYGVNSNDTNYINNLFLGFAVVHLVNACMYALAWIFEGYRPYSVLFIPEYLNMCGAGLYLTSSILYRFENTETYLDKYTFYVHYIETTAAALEVVAAFGWCYTWYLTYKRQPGRGWTFDDPDIWANFFIVVPSLVYISYNGQVLNNPESYETNTLYEVGDVLYFIGAVFYVVAALRDDGWFWFGPLAGQFGFQIVSSEQAESSDSDADQKLG